MSIEDICKEVHKLLDMLPIFKEPKHVPFDDGLYFFYENDEISLHGQNGRIVRIGNHPRSENGLKRRLACHYSGNKNSSVFRKFLGGALLRKENSSHPCLDHWEKQDLPTCEKCKPIEKTVSTLLKNNFRFHCIEIKDKNMRNFFEKKFIASISLCSKCKPSDKWLGLYAYSDNVRKSGLWNHENVFNQNLVLEERDLRIIKDLVVSTKQNY